MAVSAKTRSAILRLRAEGMRAADIARDLALTSRTVGSVLGVQVCVVCREEGADVRYPDGDADYGDQAHRACLGLKEQPMRRHADDVADVLAEEAADEALVSPEGLTGAQWWEAMMLARRAKTKEVGR